MIESSRKSPFYSKNFIIFTENEARGSLGTEGIGMLQQSVPAKCRRKLQVLRGKNFFFPKCNLRVYMYASIQTYMKYNPHTRLLHILDVENKLKFAYGD